MSKRGSETSVKDISGGKKILTTIEQIVLLKREFQKGADNVIYKLDCKSANEKTQSLVCVESKKMFDEIEIDCSYKFVLERRENRRFYLLEYEKIESVVVGFKPDLTEDDFNNELETLTNFFVQGAYCQNDVIKIFGIIQFEADYKQIDMYIKLNTSSCFGFNTNTSKKERVETILNKCYKEWLNKWWVFNVTCSRYQKYLKLIVRDNTSVEISENTDVRFDLYSNISYGPNKTFVLENIKSVCKCEFMPSDDDLRNNFNRKSNHRIMFELKKFDDNIMYATHFGIDSEDAEDVVADISSANFSIEMGAKLYCIYVRKIDEEKFNNVVSVILDDDDCIITLL
uniref:Late expression factor-3 n=1 Tax=Cryptophlebia leucotreta granulosis virus TaxID=35254 RepID=A0A2H4ZKA4_GVCL|nr:late expression factor-3 [Cryptophlebia leucotreta granulovirus]